MRRVLICFLLLSFSVIGSVRAVERAPAPKIHVTSCQVASGTPTVPQANEVGLAVRFENDSPDELKEIVWRAKYGGGYVDFRDDGQFTPAVRIDNFVLFDLGKAHLNPNVLLWALFGARNNTTAPEGMNTELSLQTYVGLNDPENCTIVSTIRASDDAVWTNTALPVEHYSLPTPGPSPNATNAPAGATKANDPLEISHCTVMMMAIARGGWINVAFRNHDATRTISKIVFRASYGLGTIDFTDVGSFSPGTFIKHQLRDNAKQDRGFTGFDDPGACTPATIAYSDGTSWTNTTLATPAPPPTPVPDGLEFDTEREHWVNGLAFPAPSTSPSPAASSAAPLTKPTGTPRI